MKNILLSIKPKYVAKILNGEKTIEIRKTAPKCELPIDVYIYCTKSKPYITYVDGKTYVQSESLGKGSSSICFNGKIVAKLTLRNVEDVERYTSNDFGVYDRFWEEYGTANLDEKELLKLSCLEKNEIGWYLKWNKVDYAHGFAWHISDLQLLDNLMELSDFGLKRAPQSWCYVEKTI